YAMCTGLPPFRAETPVAVVRRVADDEPRPIREVNPEIPAWLEAIVDRLHAKDPAGRFASASELADLLGHCLAHVQQPLADALPWGLSPAKARPPPRGGARMGRVEAAPFLVVPVVLGLAFAYRVGWVPRLAAPDKPSARPASAAPAETGAVSVLRSPRRE